MIAAPLTYEQFQTQYGHSCRDYEFWFGEAVPRSMATILHGVLQKILLWLLDEMGFVSAPEVELRIIPEAHPKPDVIATRKNITGNYPIA